MLLNMTLIAPDRTIFNCEINRNKLVINCTDGDSLEEHIESAEFEASECSILDIKKWIDWACGGCDIPVCDGVYNLHIGNEQLNFEFRDQEMVEIVYEKDGVICRNGYDSRTPVRRVVLETFARLLF